MKIKYKKYFLGCLLLIGIFLFSQSVNSQQTEGNGNPLLDYVPADTIIFSGNLERFDSTRYPLVVPNIAAHEYTLGNSPDMEKAEQFFTALYRDWLIQVERAGRQGNAQVLYHYYGLSENTAFVFYTQASMPVLKVMLTDEQAFFTTFDKASRNSGIQYQEKQLEGRSYRKYPLTSNLFVLVSIAPSMSNNDETIATMAIIHEMATEDTLKAVLGLQKPSNSLAQSQTLKTIVKRHHYLPVLVSYLDIKHLILSLYNKDTGALGQIFESEMQTFEWFQTPVCKKELLSFVEEVPRLTAGYTQWQPQTSGGGLSINNELQVVLELDNKALKAELNNMRGFIPDYVRHTEQNVLAVALGLDLSQLTPLAFYVSQTLQEQNFECPPLVALKKALAFEPARMGLIGGLLSGIHGIALAIQDVELQTETPTDPIAQNNTTTPSVSMILSIATKNPQLIWRSLSGFATDMQQNNINLSSPGKQVQSFELGKTGLKVNMVVKGEHLVFYMGKPAKALADALATETINANGMLYESINFTRLSKLYKQLDSIAAGQRGTMSMEECYALDTSFERLKRVSGSFVYQSDISDKGWLHRLKTDIHFPQDKGKSIQVVGQYEAYGFNDQCRLEKTGEESFVEDGSGHFRQYSEDGQCVVYETRYQWQQDGDKLQIHYQKERHRSNELCSNPFEAWQSVEEKFQLDECLLSHDERGKFACWFHQSNNLKLVYKPID